MEAYICHLPLSTFQGAGGVGGKHQVMHIHAFAFGPEPHACKTMCSHVFVCEGVIHGRVVLEVIRMGGYMFRE